MTTKYRRYLGPSQFMTALGFDSYKSAEELKEEFESGYTIGSSNNMLYGSSHEAVGSYYYQKLFGQAIVKAPFIVDPHNARIGGIADGLLDKLTGIEIKCHLEEKNLLKTLPLKYRIQMAGYMYLYQRSKWILMSCTFHADHTLNKYKVFELTWDQVKDQWTQEWYPKLCDFVNQIEWKTK